MSEIVLPIFYLILFNWIIVKLKFLHLSILGIKASLFAFNIKVFSGVILWLVYTYYYSERNTNDQFRYFDDAAIMFQAFKINPKYFFELFFDLGRNKVVLKPFYEQFMNWDKEYNYAWIIDNRTVIRFNALVHFFSWGNFHVHTIFMNFLSFIGLLLLYKSVSNFFRSKEKLLFTGIFLLPTVTFWGSGVLKEGILIFGLGTIVYSFFNLLNQQFRFNNFFLLIVGIFVLASIKVYVLLALIPAFITYAILKTNFIKNYWYAFVFIQLILALIIFNLKYIHPELDIVNKLWFKRNDFVNVANEWDAKSAIPAIMFDKSAISILLHTPQALFNVLLRPHFFEIKSIMYLMPLIENVLLVGFLFLAIFNFKKPEKESIYFVLFSLVFIVYLSAMIGLVTPILGAIVRYKLPVMPFLYLVILTFVDKEKLKIKFPFLNKYI